MSRTSSSHAQAANAATGPSFSMNDIYYTLFRHKWKIMILTVLGCAIAAVVYKKSPITYASTSSLLIRYVEEGKGPTSSASGDQFKSPDARGGGSIIAAEMEIIQSLDVANQVVALVGAEKILAQTGGKDPALAAGAIRDGLTVTKQKGSSVIVLTFTSTDSTIVQPVLAAIIEVYLKRHVEIHRPAGSFDDFLTQQTDQMRAKLAQTDEELRKARATAGIISLADTRKAQSETINALKRQILDAERALAQKRASLSLLHVIKDEKEASDKTIAPAPIDPTVIEKYKNALSLLALLHKREQELLMSFTPESTRVKDVRDRIATAEEQKEKLESSTPGLRAAVSAVSPRNPSGENSVDPNQKLAELVSLETEVKVLKQQLDQTKGEVAALDSLEANIQELERRKAVEESNYKAFAANLDRIRMDEALGTGLVTNISRVQNPTPPFRAVSLVQQIAAGIAAGGLLLGFISAFLTEYLLDGSVRRTSQIERRLGIDVLVSIPTAKAQRSSGTGNSTALALKNDTVPPWEPANTLHAYYTALRDRTISFFESRNLYHKPRLVALTGLGRDHGAAEIAAGLAGCLSETGEGKVLFVDMTTSQGAAQQFYQGQTVSSIDDALEADQRARVSENLYVVGSEKPSDNKALPLILPKRFGHLVPKLRASDFDYIIFNLPPVNNLSVTPRLAQHMDIVLMVMESEKTDMGSAIKAKQMLGNTKSHVAAILNKTHQYVPRSLVKELS